MEKEKKAGTPVEPIQRYRFTDKKLWSAMLGLERPWRVSRVELEIGGLLPGRLPGGGPSFLVGTIRVRVEHSRGGKVKCAVRAAFVMIIGSVAGGIWTRCSLRRW